jgi:hypothetical protein
MPTYNVLVFGASYGSLFATKLLLAGHSARLVCLPAEAELINEQGTRVRMPVRGREGLVEVDSRELPGRLSAAPPDAIDPGEHDLVALAMQEPQYGSPGVAGLLRAVAEARLPCVSIMNMPPLPYLERLGGVDVAACRDSYTKPEVWDGFDPSLVTMCSPDPQAFRPPEEPDNVLQVRLPTNFKAARFDSERHTAILRELEADIDRARLRVGGEEIALPVRLVVHDSVYVPMAKWSMLIAGNYRCIQADAARPIQEAVHDDLDVTRSVYEWVGGVCQVLGAAPGDLVPFEKYAAAAQSLVTPSSVARALFAGAKNVERVDRLVQTLAAQHDMRSAELDEIVSLVDARLEANRAAESQGASAGAGR